MNITGLGGLLGNLISRPQPLASNISSRIISKRDADGDGRLSMRELGRSAGKLRGADSDRDGYLSQEELLTAVTKKMDANSQGLAAEGLNGLKTAIAGLQAGTNGLSDAASMTNTLFAVADKDKDGLLSDAELGKSADMFSFADSNGDGSISKEEALQALVKRRESLQALQGYAQNTGSSLKDLLAARLDISEKEAASIISYLENNSLSLKA